MPFWRENLTAMHISIHRLCLRGMGMLTGVLEILGDSDATVRTALQCQSVLE